MLPICFGDRFVGRIEPRIEPKAETQDPAIDLSHAMPGRALAKLPSSAQQLKALNSTLKQGAPAIQRIPLPVEAPNKAAQTATGDLRLRTKSANCAKHSFSCEWPRLSEGFRDLKKLFTSSPSKAKKS